MPEVTKYAPVKPPTQETDIVDEPEVDQPDLAMGDDEPDEERNVWPVPLDAIRLDGPTQLRVSLREATVDEYASAYRRNKTLPAPAVYFDGDDYWVGDGHQRIAAAQKAGMEQIHCYIHRGTVRDAILYAVGANEAHGDRRTRYDARNAVATLLRDQEWSTWSDREIGRRCGVDHKTVAAIRRQLTGEIPQSSLRTGADGRTIDTSRIGARPSTDGGAAPHATGPGSDDHTSPDFDQPPDVQADEPPDVAEGRRRDAIPVDAEVQGDGPEREGCQAAGSDPAQLPNPVESTDEQYLETLPIRSHLAPHCRERFDAEALASRAFGPIRREVRVKSKAIRDELDSRNGKGGRQGPWRRKLRRFLEMNDPSRWLVCGACAGTGEVPSVAGRCRACYGNGYMID